MSLRQEAYGVENEEIVTIAILGLLPPTEDKTPYTACLFLAVNWYQSGVTEYIICILWIYKRHPNGMK